MGFVVDANAINQFQKERASEPDDGVRAIELILEHSYIVLDEGGHCKQEWMDCAAGSFPLALADWLADQLAAGRVRIVEMIKNPPFKALRQIGVPKKDHKWIQLAVTDNSKFIVTNDIDLIEPKAKNSSNQIKDRIRSQCRGSVQKFLDKRLGITVCLCCHISSGEIDCAEAS